MQKSNYTYKDFEIHCKAILKATPVNKDEPIDIKLKRITKAKKDYGFFFSYYFPNYATAPCASFHIKLANEVLNKPTFKGIFEAFRGSAKSTHADIGIPLWLKINDQLKCMLLVGQTEDKANRLLAGLQAQLMSNQRFIYDFGEQFSWGNWADGEFVTKDGSAFFALGMGQSPRGTRHEENRPDYIVCDDLDSKKLSKNQRLVREAVEWIEDDLMGTMDIGKERFLFVNNRISKHSILANLVNEKVLKREKNNRWFYLRVNAVDNHGNPSWPEKYTREYWRNKKADMALRSWQREYMNNPIEEGTVFQNEWIKWCNPLPLNRYDRLVMYVDPSFKNTPTSDHKACKFWGRKGRELHLIDAFVRKCSISTMVKWLYDFHDKLTKTVIVDYFMEANFLQDLILDEFSDEGDVRGYQLPIRPDKRSKPDKFSRIEATSALYERGFIFYNHKKQNDPDFARAIEQLLAIEPGSKSPDDSPDADEGAIYILQNNYRISQSDIIIGHRQNKHQW